MNADARARPVGPLALLALGVNGIVGVGIFFVPADLAQQVPGGGSVLVFAVTAIVLAPVALTFAALGRRFPEDGGPVVFARAAFGERVSFLVGWVAYVSALASLSAVTAGLIAASGASIGLAGPVAQRGAAFLLVTSLALVCASGLRISARAWTTLTVLKLVPLLALAAAWLAYGPAPAVAAPAPPVSTAAWLSAALTATFAYQGFEIVPVIAGQARSPERSVPWATVGSLALAAALYVVLQSACVAALPRLASSPRPLADAAAVLGGEVLSRAVAAGTSVSALGIAFGMMVTTPHYLAALAREGGLAFALDQVSPRGVPRRALFVTWVLVAILVQAGSRSELFALSSVAVLSQFVATALSLLMLALDRKKGLTRWHVALAVPAAVVGLVLASGASRREAVVAAIAIALGLSLRAASRARC